MHQDTKLDLNRKHVKRCECPCGEVARMLTDPVPDLLDLGACLTVGNVDVDSCVKRCVCVGAVLVVNVNFEVEDLGKHLCGLGGCSVMKSIATYAIAVIGVKGARGDDLLQELKIVGASCMQQSLVCRFA